MGAISKEKSIERCQHRDHPGVGMISDVRATVMITCWEVTRNTLEVSRNKFSAQNQIIDGPHGNYRAKDPVSGIANKNH